MTLESRIHDAGAFFIDCTAPVKEVGFHVIQSFGDQTTEDVWDGTTNARTRRLPPEVLSVAPRKLDLLNAAADIDDLRRPPGNRLEALKGDLVGFHSIRINSQWRIIFQWTNAGPTGVKIVDYH